MASVKINRNKAGELISYKWTACIGRDGRNKQIWSTLTVSKDDPRVEGCSPSKTRDWEKIKRHADLWEETEKAAYKKEREKDKLAKRTKDRITLEAFIVDFWLKKHVENGEHKPSTKAFYKNMSKDIIRWVIEEKPTLKLAQVDKSDILDFLTWVRTKPTTKKGKPYSQTTMQHLFATLRNILAYAVDIEVIIENPCKKIKPTDRPKREHREIDFLDAEQAAAFIKALDSEKEKTYWGNETDLLYWCCMVNVLIITGLRRGELVGLQWGDLDKSMILTVRRNVTVNAGNKGEQENVTVNTGNKEEQEAKKKIFIGTTKGKAERKAPVSAHVYAMLQELKAAQDRRYGTLMPTAYIFCRANNPYLPLYPTEPTRLLAKFCKRHGLPNMSPHDLRHTAASLALEAGASAKEIQMLLGHRDAATSLNFYTGIAEKVQRRTTESLDSLIRQTGKNV